jgi:MFS family permease
LILLVFVLSRWSGGLVDRYGPKWPLVLGPIIVAVGFGLFAVPSIGGSYWSMFFPALVVLGLGLATTVAPLTTTVMNSVPEEQAGIASGVNNAVSRVAGVLAIAVLGIVMLGTFDSHLMSRLDSIPISDTARQELASQRIKLAAIEVPQDLDVAVREEIRQAVRESFIAGFRLVMRIAAGLALGSAATAWLMIRDKRAQ